ncbi:DUF3857 domain-containing protein [Aurantiacibacter spongiae]|uniref:DUF3857 domain-containing protein n=2 Tax=Aurantiacibacter spongiae TaxID=2488860 RepID=A0A3N5CWF6_9SPHN|nr:DUF3857 domain-containing protein [Aurantiacibacter spongiae]
MPDDARGVVFIRRQDTVVHLATEGERIFNAFRIRLLQPAALQLGNIAIQWNPAAGTPQIHSILIHRDGATIDVLDQAEFEILRREDNLEAAAIDGLLTATLRVPDLRIDDEPGWAFTVPTADPTLADRDAGLLALGATPPAGRYRLSLTWEDGQEPAIRATDDLAAMITRTDNAVLISADTPSALIPPKDAPPRYNWQRVLEYSDFADWPALSRRVHALFQEAASVPGDSPVAREAARIAAAHDTDLARAAAALELVQKQVRYVYVGLNGSNIRPARAEITWERRYGDCKGKTALLLALLGAMGIEAEVVLANNQGGDDGLDERLPSPLLFDHVLVRATIDGQQYWLDGTFPDAFGPAQRPVPPYRWVLPLAANGAPLDRVEWQPERHPTELALYEIDARAGFDEPAHITQTNVTRGLEALAQYAQLSQVTDDQLETAIRSQLAGSTSWNTIDSVKWRFDEASQASVMEISGTGPVNWEDEGGAARSLILPGGGFSPPDRRQRSAADGDAPFWQDSRFTCHVTSVRLPETTEPSEWSHNSAFETAIYGSSYARVFDLRDGTMRMMRVFRTDESEISAEQAASDTRRLSGFDNSMARINFEPGLAGDAAMQPNDADHVPATFDRDWVADDSACLSAVD